MTNQRKHSRIGIASFIVSIVGAIGSLITLVVAGLGGSMHLRHTQLFFAIIGLLVIFMILVNLVALGLGIGGFFSKNTKKALTIAGVSVSGGITLLILLVIMLGVASRS